MALFIIMKLGNRWEVIDNESYRLKRATKYNDKLNSSTQEKELMIPRQVTHLSPV